MPITVQRLLLSVPQLSCSGAKYSSIWQDEQTGMAVRAGRQPLVLALSRPSFMFWLFAVLVATGAHALSLGINTVSDSVRQ